MPLEELNAAPEAEQPEKEPKPRCRNCEKKMPRKASFCPHCGQKQQTGLESLSDLLSKFWRKILHVDSKFLRTSRHLLVPGSATSAFIQGKTKKYTHPVRYFFVCVFILLLYIHNTSDDSPMFVQVELKDGESYDMIVGRIKQQDAVQGIWDQMADEQIVSEAETQALFDTIMAHAMDSISILRRDSFTFQKSYLLSKTYRFSTRDVINMTGDSIIELYHVDHPVDRLAVRRGLRLMHNPEAVGQFWLGIIAWTLLFQIVIMAGVLKLLYYRRDRYYVEHFVFMLHIHSSFILFAVVFGLLRRVAGWTFLPMALPLIWLGGNLLLGMLWYYGQKWPKTTLKWLILGVAYIIVLFIVVVLSIGVSFLLF